jgi:selenophosphate synthase
VTKGVGMTINFTLFIQQNLLLPSCYVFLFHSFSLCGENGIHKGKEMSRVCKLMVKHNSYIYNYRKKEYGGK